MTTLLSIFLMTVLELAANGKKEIDDRDPKFLLGIIGWSMILDFLWLMIKSLFKKIFRRG